MNTLDSYPTAGTGFAAQKREAGGAMRSLRDDLWRRVYEMRQRQGARGVADAGKQRKLGMISAGLGMGAALPWADWLKKAPQFPGGGGSMAVAPYVDPIM